MQRRPNTCLTVAVISLVTTAVVCSGTICFVAFVGALVPNSEATEVSALPTLEALPEEATLGVASATPESVMPTETAIPLSPTGTAVATQVVVPTQASVELIINVTELLNSPMSFVDDQLEFPGEILPFTGEEIPEVPGGGLSRDYLFASGLWVFIFFDQDGLAKNIVVQGLSDYGYEIDEWPELMARLNFPITAQPDREAPAGRHWDDYNGHGISVTSNGIGGEIETVKVYIAPE